MTISDINVLARLLTGTDTNSYTAANLLIAVNASYERVTGKILAETSGGKWLYGDYNYTGFPTFTVNLVAGTQQYDFGDFSTRPLTILGAEVVDNNGTSHVLKRITLKDILEIDAQNRYQSTNGLPLEYEIRDNQIVLYPAPAAANVTATNGLRLFYLRTADVFTSAQVTTGTKTPGFPAPWHDILSYEAAYTFAVAKGLKNANQLKFEVDKKEKEMMDYIFTSDQDSKARLTVKTRPFR